MKNIPLPELIDKINALEFPNEIKIGNVWYRNPQKAANNYIAYLQSNPGNRRYLPYYKHLLELYYTLIGGEWVVLNDENEELK